MGLNVNDACADAKQPITIYANKFISMMCADCFTAFVADAFLVVKLSNWKVWVGVVVVMMFLTTTTTTLQQTPPPPAHPSPPLAQVVSLQAGFQNMSVLSSAVIDLKVCVRSSP